MNKSFQSGLRLNFFDDKKICLSFSHVEKPKWSRFTFVVDDLPVNLRNKFNKIQILMWSCEMLDPACLISSLERLSPVSTLIVLIAGIPDFEVNFDINYEMTTTTSANSAATQLQHFTFGFCKRHIPLLKDLLSDQPDFNDLIIRETKRTVIPWLTYTVKRNIEQHQLVMQLIEVGVRVAESRS